MVDHYSFVESFKNLKEDRLTEFRATANLIQKYDAESAAMLEIVLEDIQGRINDIHEVLVVKHFENNRLERMSKDRFSDYTFYKIKCD